MADKPKLETFIRDDRGSVAVTVDGLQDLLVFAEAFLVQEKYGLSVVFDDGEIEYIAEDPLKIITAEGSTPAAAIMTWLTLAEQRGLVES